MPTEQAATRSMAVPGPARCYLGGFLEEVSDVSPAKARWVLFAAWFLRPCRQPLQAGTTQVAHGSSGLPVARGQILSENPHSHTETGVRTACP